METRLVALAAGLVLAMAASVAAGASYDLVLNGGHVMDPESGLDGVRSIGVRDGQVVAISAVPLSGTTTVELNGLVVAPGFIDLHVHGQHPAGYDYMARDGVTTALDLEAGVHGTAEFLSDREGKARIHYGTAAGHIGSRIYAKHGFSTGHALTSSLDGGFMSWVLSFVQRWIRPTGWMREPADEAEQAEIIESLAAELDAGAIGIGMGLAYTPGATPEEIRAVFALAAERNVPCFVHIAEQDRVGDLGPLEAVLGHAKATGASLHVVHINSSSRSSIEAYLDLIEHTRHQGVDVTTEAYPYTAASTMIESALFDEGFRERRGVDYGDLQWAATGERLTAESFEKYRAEGGTVIIHMMEPEWIETAIAHPLVMIASDGMPMVAGAHPRGAGTHARVLGLYVREGGVISLMEAIAKLSFIPGAAPRILCPRNDPQGAHPCRRRRRSRRLRSQNGDRSRHLRRAAAVLRGDRACPGRWDVRGSRRRVGLGGISGEGPASRRRSGSRSLERPLVVATVPLFARDRGARHHPGLVTRPGAAAVQYAAVVPDDDVPFAPGMGEDTRRLRGLIREAIQQCAALLEIASHDVGSVASDEEAFAARRRVDPHYRVFDGRQGAPLFVAQHVHPADQSLGIAIAVHPDRVFEFLSQSVIESIVSGAHVRPFGLAARGRHRAGGKQ